VAQYESLGCRENHLSVVTDTSTIPNAIARFVFDGDPLRCAPRASAARVLQVVISDTEAVRPVRRNAAGARCAGVEFLLYP
jgi:hypothetical protein